MKSFHILVCALAFIEENLKQPITQEEIAKHCCCSLSALQKLFSYALKTSIKRYISHRRLCESARELIKTDKTILSIALDYGYNSAEVYLRAFTKMWGITPSEFRATRRFSGLFPRLSYKGGNVMSRTEFDLSELYDTLCDKDGTYILCFDIIGLIPINEISFEAGDAAILETGKRIEEVMTDDMLMFRIGGDEFVLVTGLSDYAKTVETAKAVTQRNGESITHNGRKIPLSLRVCGEKLNGKSLKYSELFTHLSDELEKSRDAEQTIFITE